MRNISCSLLVIVVVWLGIPGPHQACGGTVDDGLQQALAQIENGVGGFVGPIEKIERPIPLRYQSFRSINVKVTHYIFVAGDEFWKKLFGVERVLLSALVQPSSVGAGQIEFRVQVDELSVTNSGNGDHTIQSPVYGSGMSRTAVLLDNGEIVSSVVEAAAEASAEELDPQMRDIILSMFDRVSPREFVAESARQDTAVFTSYFDEELLQPLARRIEGSPPSIRGEVSCGIMRCALVELGETVIRSDGNREYDDLVKGHILIELPSLQPRSGIVLHRSRSKIDGEDLTTGELTIFAMVD